MTTRTTPILTEYERAIMERINSAKALEQYLRTYVSPELMTPIITDVVTGYYSLLALCKRRRVGD